ncbi:hypothetical protein ACKWTF_012729 [Chironomus riparius]
MDSKSKMQKSDPSSPRKYARKIILIAVIILSTITIAFSYLIYNEIKKAPLKAKMECYVSYLTANSLIDESFNSFGQFFGDAELCETIIENKIDDIESTTKTRLNDIAGHRAYTICIIKTLKNDSNFINRILMLEVLEYTRISWKFWKYFERNSRYKNLEHQLSFQESYAINYCQGNHNQNEIDGSGFGNVVDDDAEDENEEVPRKPHSSEYNSNDMYFDDD